VSWHIDRDGIHIDAQSVEEAEDDLKIVEWWLTKTPRTVAEKNAQSAAAMIALMGGAHGGVPLGLS